jgi:thioredoxin 1
MQRRPAPCPHNHSSCVILLTGKRAPYFQKDVRMAAGRKLIVAGIVLAGLSLAVWLAERHLGQGGSDTGSSDSELESANWPRGDIYPDGAQAPEDLRNALIQAARENKRVIVDFGGNWCPDCRVLDIYLHGPSNLALLEANYTLVHVNIGRYDENQDLAARYDIPLSKGVPALAVLDSDGKPLYVQRNGEFEAMGRMDSTAVTNFLTRWKR